MNDKKPFSPKNLTTASDKKAKEPDYKKEIKILKRKVHFYENMIRVMPGNVYWKDLNGTLLGFNQNVHDIMANFSKLNPIGKTWSELDTARINYANTYFNPQKIIEADLDVMKNDKTVWIEEEGFDPQSNPAIYYSQKTPLHDENDKVIGLVGISIDITPRKKLEEQLRQEKEKADKEKEEAIKANLAKSRFLAIMNHEIRTPVSCIISLTELLKDAALDENAAQLLSNLDDSAKHLLQLINSVLDFNRLELEQTPPEKQPFALRPTIETIFNMLQTAATTKHLKLFYDISSRVPEFLLSDERFIKHILINLINNSIKFTKEGSVSLTIDYHPETKRIFFTIKDTGIGIAEENQKKVFLPFQQIKDTYIRDTAREGTGLGLTIVKALVDKLSGNISLTSKLGEGCIFHIDFPCDFTEKLPEKDANVDPISLPPNLKVLMIEDDPTIQLIHQKIFGNLKLPLTIAKNGTEGLNQVDQYDLLFLDLSLPDISGFDVVERIRAREDKTKDIPIIVLTAYSESTEKNRALDLGANLFLSKPLNTAEIPKIIYSVLNKAKGKNT